MPANNTFIWTAIGSGEWSNPANWDDDVVPTTGATVELPSELSSYVVSYSPVLAIDSLSDAGAGLDIKPGASLTLDDSSVMSGALTIEQGGKLSVADGATLTFGGGEINGPGVLAGGGTLLLASGDTTIGNGAKLSVANLGASGGLVTLNEALTYAGAYTQSGGTLTLTGGTALTDASLTGGTVNGSHVLYLEGESGVGAITFGGTVELRNLGTVTLSGGSLTIGDASGSVAFVYNASSSVWDIADDSGIGQGVSTSSYFDNFGTFTKTGGTTTSTVFAKFFDTGVVSVATGTLAFSGPSSVFAGKVSGLGVLAIAGGVATIASGAVFSVSNWSISGTPTTVTLNEDLNYTGAFSETANSTLTLTGGLLLNGVATFSSATVNGSQELQTWGATTVSGLTIGGAVSWDNVKTVTQSGGDVTIVSNASTTIDNQGVWNITDDSGIALGKSSTSGIVNSGRFEKSGGTQNSTVAASFYDLGTVVVTSGTLDFAGPSNMFAGAVSGAGAIQFSGGTSTLSFGTSLGTAGFSEINAGTTLNVDDYVVYVGTFNQGAKADIVVANGDALSLVGTMNVAGTVSGAGAFAILGGTATFAASAAITVSDWSIAGAVTLNGGRTYTGTFSMGAYATLTLTAGTAFTGSATFSGSTVNGSHVLYTEGTTSVSDFTIGGTVEWQITNTVMQSGGNVAIGDASGGTAFIYNTASGVYDIDDSNIGLGASTSSYFDNLGTFATTDENQTSNILAKFYDTGTVSVASGDLDFEGPANAFAGAISGAGAVEFNSGTSTFNAGTSMTTSGLSENGGTLLIDESLSYAGAFNQSGGTLTVASGDTLTLTGTSSLAGKVNGAGTLAFAGGTATLTSSFLAPVFNLTISGPGTVVTVYEGYTGYPYYRYAPFTYAGAFSESTNATLTLAGSMSLNGSATFSGGTLNGSGILFTDGATSVSDLTIGGSVEWKNSSTVMQNGAGVTIDESYITAIDNAGVWNITDNSGIGLKPLPAVSIYNGGTFEKTGGALASQIAPEIINQGTISATSGTLELEGALFGNGTYEVGNGATLQLDDYDPNGAAYSQISYQPGGGELILDARLDPAETISIRLGAVTGFAAGDSLDLLGFGTGSTFQYVPNNPGNASGVLGIFHGSNTASFDFTGSYTTASFNHVTTSAGTVLTFA